MAADSRMPEAADGSPDGQAGKVPEVTVHTGAPGRFVFTERDNSDGWIATDLTVELRE